MTATEQEPNALRELLQVKPPSETVEWVNLLIYGEAGAGKTYLAGSAADDPRTSPVLFLDVEGGVTTIRHRKEIDVVPIRSMDQITKVYNDIFRSIEDGRILYKTIVVDSLTELADLDMRIIMKNAYSAKPDSVDIDVASPREWGKTRNHMRTIVRAFRDLPCHVIYTSGLGQKQDEGQPTKNYPGFSGKLQHEIPGFMDIVGLLTAEVNPVSKERSRKLQVAGTRGVVAKDRTSALGDLVINPTIPMIWDLITGT